MSVVLWQGNSARRYPRAATFGQIQSLSSFASPPGPSTSGRLRRQISSPQPIYKWDNNLSTLGINEQWGGSISLSVAASGSGILEHYDTGTETDILYLVPVLSVAATLGSRIVSPALTAVPALAGSAHIVRQASGAMSQVHVLSTLAHTETGGNQSASGILYNPPVLSGTGTIQHFGLSALVSRPTLSVIVGRELNAVGALVLEPQLSGKSNIIGTGELRQSQSLSGLARSTGKVWVVIPEAPEGTDGWTIQ